MMHRVACAAVLLISLHAFAREPLTAIAPMTSGESAPAELVRAFADELPRALAAAGFVLVPPNEVDMKIGERPELLQCHAGGCLVEEAAFLRVARLALPRLERAPDGNFTIAVGIFDAAARRTVADAVDRATTPDEVKPKLAAMAQKLRDDLSRPGRLEVTAAPGARLTVDGQPRGVTPWAGALPPGDHVVALDSGGERVERDVNVPPGATARVDIAVEATTPTPPHRNPALRPLKWATLALGIAGLAAGITLIALDGRPACDRAPGQTLCPRELDTLYPGAGVTAAGGALAVTSVILFTLDRPRR